MQYDPHLWLYVASGLTLATCAVIVHWWEGRQRVTRLFVGFSSTLVLWSAIRGAMVCTVDPELITRLGRYEYAVIAIATAQLFHALMLQLRTEQQASVAINLAWISAIVIAVSALTLPDTAAYTVPRAMGLDVAVGPSAIALLAWKCLLISYFDVTFVRGWRRTAPGSAERKRLAHMRWMLVFVHLAPLDLIHGATGWLYPASFVTLTMISVCMAWVTLKHGVAIANLAHLADKVLSRIGDGILILGADGRILRANGTAAELLELELSGLAERDVERVLGDGKDLGWLRSLAHGELHREQHVQVRTADGGIRELRVEVSESTDRHGRFVAASCHLRDRTDTRRRDREGIERQQRDPLTDALSRKAFKALTETLTATGVEKHYSVLVAAPRDLRKLRSRLGAIGADNELQALASALRLVSGTTGTVARIGDDEFVLLLEDDADYTQARQCAADLQQKNDGLVIGVVATASAFADTATLLKAISVARRGAAADTGPVYWLNDDALDAQGHLETELRTAITDGQLVVHYQPVVDIRHRCITGFEALVRWQHPDRGLLLPGDFMPLAEELGLVGDIDRAVVRTALADIGRFRARTPALNLTVNVNLSREGIEHPDLLEFLQQSMLATGARPDWLQLEILEGAVIDRGAQERLESLARAGYTLCVDDFGTGYSSLSRLHQLPIGILKIDRSFVLALNENKGEAIVRGIASIGRRLGLRLVAEGVEDWPDVQRLLAMECSVFQGFLFSPAVPADTVLDWFARGALPWSMSADQDDNGNPESLILALA